MDLSPKQKNFSSKFLSIFEINIKLWTISKKEDVDSLCICEITESEIRSQINV